MKVLHIQKLDGFAGSENYLTKILPSLNKEIDVIFLGVVKNPQAKSNEQFFDSLTEHNIKFREVSFQQHSVLSLVSKVLQIIKAEKVDIVHAHLVHAIFWVALAKLFTLGNAKWKFISTWHGYDEDYQAKHGFDPSHKKYDRFWFVSKFSEFFTDKTITISNGLKNLLEGLDVAHSRKTKTIHYGFNFPEVNHQGINNIYKKSENQLLIIGRLLPVKGHRYAFQVIKKLKSQYPELALVLVGNGAHEAKLKKQAEEMGIAEHVFFEGFSKKIHEYLYHSKIVLIPSVAEGFGVVALEAMHNKRPIISFDVPALNEIIIHGETGFLIEPFDVVSFSEKVDYLLQNKSTAKEMGMKGKERLEKKFSIEAMTQKTLTEYQKLYRNS